MSKDSITVFKSHHLGIVSAGFSDRVLDAFNIAVLMLDSTSPGVYRRTVIESFHQSVVVVVSEGLSDKHSLDEFYRQSGFVGSIRGITGSNCSAYIVDTFTKHTETDRAFLATQRSRK